jgi:membrane-associated PAP2 superfamily phosphatase
MPFTSVMKKIVLHIVSKRDIHIPALLLLLCSIPFFIKDLDISVSSLFYDASLPQMWIYVGVEPWEFLYNYGTWPALALAGCSLLLGIASYFVNYLKPQRKTVMYLAAVMIIGPGLIVNTLFKDNFGRPRPRDIVEFGGQQQYQQLLHPNWGNPGRSFPCGHCSAAFYFFVLYFCGKGREKKWLPYAGLTFGMGYGIFMGVARIMQGGHFLSDVLWSAGLVYLTSGVLFYLINPIPDPNT